METQFLCRMLSRSLTIKQRPIIGITSNNRGRPGLFCPLSFGMATSSKGLSFPSRTGSGFNYKHWFVVMNITEAANKSRDELINIYVKTLADGIGVSEEEAKMKLYSVFTRYTYSYGANISLEDAKKLEKCQHALRVYPDYYIDEKNKDYGGEPVINGQVAAYDDKYYEHCRRVREPKYACTDDDDGALHNGPDDDGALHNSPDDDYWVIYTESDDDGALYTGPIDVGDNDGPDKYDDTDDTDNDLFAADDDRFAADDDRIAGTA